MEAQRGGLALKERTKVETMELSLTGESTKDSKGGGSSPGEPGSIKIPTLKAWEGSRLKTLGRDALPSYKSVVAVCLGPVKDMERYFKRLRMLNRGLDTEHRTVYERRVEPNGAHHVLSIDCRLSRHWGRRGDGLSVAWDR
jgi:hypothetical protein